MNKNILSIHAAAPPPVADDATPELQAIAASVDTKQNEDKDKEDPATDLQDRSPKNKIFERRVRS